MCFLCYYGLIESQNEMEKLFRTNLVHVRDYVERKREIPSNSHIWIVLGGWYWFIYEYLGFW